MPMWARVNRLTGKTTHYRASGSNDNVHEIEKTPPLDSRLFSLMESLDEKFRIEELPPATWLEIVEEDDGAYLCRYDQQGEFLADTWHENVDRAKWQAEFEFEVPGEAWNAGRLP